MGGKSSTTTTTTQPPKQVMQAYEDLLARATPVSQTAYQPYTGGVNGSGFEQNQITGFQNIANLAGSQDQNFGNAASYLNQSAVPTSQTVDQFMSPYLSDVVNSTIANMNEQNAEQQQGVLGNAAALGALGGNRVGVAQAELARQQNLANQSTIANLYNTGYNSALSAAQAQQAAEQGAASGLAGLGSTAMQTALQQAAAQVGAGTQQQQFNYQQYQNQRSYPFETTSWLANIVEGLGAGMGGTTSQTAPAGNTGSAVLGGLLGLGSLFLNRGGVVHRATGGVIPYSRPSGIVPMNDNNMTGANDNTGYVPQVATAGAPSRSTMPQGVAQPSQDNSSQMLNQGVNQMEKAIQQKYPNGVLPALSSPRLPGTAPIPTPSPNDPAGAAAALAPVANQPPVDTGILAKLGSLFGFAEGGQTPGLSDAQSRLNDLDKRFGAGISNGSKWMSQNPSFSPDTIVGQARGLMADNPGLKLPEGGFLSTTFGNFFNGDMPYAARGGVIRGYDAGGGVDDFDPLYDPVVLPFEKSAPFASIGNVPTDQTAVAPRVDRANASPLPFLDAPKDVKDYPVADVVPQGAYNGPEVYPGSNKVAAEGLPMPPSGVVPPRPAPAAYSVGNAPQMAPAFDKINEQYGLPQGYLNRTAYIESRFNPNADNGISQGEFQFTPPTARQYGLRNPYDALASADAAARLAVSNMNFLQGGLGRQPTAGELYLAHQQGANGALNLLTHPNDLATDVVGRKAVIMNGGRPDMTAAQFANLWTSRFDNSPVDTTQTAGIAHPAPSGVAGDISAGSTPSASTGVLSAPRGSQPSEGGSGILSDLLHGRRPHLSDDMRMALLSAGLGMMAGTSPNFATNVGTGGLQGLKTYQERKQFGLENQRVDLAAQELAMRAKEAAADIAKNTAETGNINVQTQAGRYQQTVTPAGILVRDVTQPLQAPHLVTWDQLQKVGNPLPAEAVPMVPGTGAPAAPQGASSQGASSQGTEPVTPQNSPLFATNAPPSVPINDGRLFTPMGQEEVKTEATEALKAAQTGYQSAQTAQTQLSEMQHDLSQLPPDGLMTPGTGFAERTKVGRAIISGLAGLGIDVPDDFKKGVAAGEDLNKLTTRLGFDLSSALGSREAAMIVNQAIGAVPGGENTPLGAQRIIAGIEAANQRKIDYYTFLQDYASKTGGTVKGADQIFNAVNPPELYAIASYVPAGAIQALRQHPDLASQFDAKYGSGTSGYVLGSWDAAKRYGLVR